MDTNESFRNSLYTKAVFVKVNAEKEGTEKDLATRYHVKGYPTFLLVNSDGETVDRWMGYGGPDPLLAQLDAALADPTTVKEKLARLEGAPNAAEAEKLGDIYAASFDTSNSLAMYRKAQELSHDPAGSLTAKIFDSVATAYRTDDATLDEVAAAADSVLAQEGEEQEPSLVTVAETMTRIARKEKKPEIAFPYLEAALAATEGTLDEHMIQARKTLLLEKAVSMDKDMETAVVLKRDLMPEGWEEEAGGLNEFAWWCFENKVHLEEAERYARKAVDLAESGREKAMILDTLAELCNERGNCDEAVKLMEVAVQEQPDDDYFQKQLTRFQEILAERKS